MLLHLATNYRDLQVKRTPSQVQLHAAKRAMIEGFKWAIWRNHDLEQLLGGPFDAAGLIGFGAETSR